MVALATWAIAPAALPDPGELIREAPEELGRWTYAFAGAMAFLELGTLLGVPVPFEVGVLLSGAAAGEGEIALVPLVGVVFAFAAVGETVNFFTGRRLGRPLLERHGPRLGISPKRLAAVEGHFRRRGQATVVIGRFVPFARSLTPFVAGSSLMPYRHFLGPSLLGNGLWAAVFVGLGYGFYRSADELVGTTGRVGLALLAVLVAAAAVVLLRQRRRRLN